MWKNNVAGGPASVAGGPASIATTTVGSFVWGLSVLYYRTTTFNCIDTNVLIIKDLPAKSPINLRGLLFLHRLGSSPTYVGANRMLTSTSIGFRLIAISCLVTLSALVELDTYLGTLQYCQSQSCKTRKAGCRVNMLPAPIPLASQYGADWFLNQPRKHHHQ
jgi:hypothetical protein